MGIRRVNKVVLVEIHGTKQKRVDYWKEKNNGSMLGRKETKVV